MTPDIDRRPINEDTDERTAFEAGYSNLTHQFDRRASGSDRVTVFPADATDDTKMSTWMTVNVGCVKKLECLR
ncbi:hypothetical protein DJ82_11165 [Halorubrum sp. Ib24]|nr:hypothetical protein DJ82_11165 [Halorubrum sp. Ib24]OYR42052.1 hypothetical protein DJ75_13165 [Halorubrum sp. Eb13]OYR51043.1 hypothetical protein DJ73_14660 [Halorubrum sp. Ea1]